MGNAFFQDIKFIFFCWSMIRAVIVIKDVFIVQSFGVLLVLSLPHHLVQDKYAMNFICSHLYSCHTLFSTSLPAFVD